MSSNFLFIGDSFTEGVGLPYEDTFVGLFDGFFPEESVSNAGVISYSPIIYQAKLKFLVDELNMRPKHVIVAIDVSDVQDEAYFYELSDIGTVIDQEHVARLAPGPVRIFVRDNFPLLRSVYRILKYGTSDHVKADPLSWSRGAWTYKNDLTDYGESGVDGGIRRAVSYMTELADYTSAKGIALSVVVYPWPGQIVHEDLLNNRHEQIWADFCKHKCHSFISLFPEFHSELSVSDTMDVIEKYYFPGDVHFNKQGNKLIANKLSDLLKER